jgi:hypothetical protein
MKLTVELEDADQIATLAHLAEILALSRNDQDNRMGSIYPGDVINSVRDMLEAFDVVLNYIDSPFSISVEDGKIAGSLAYRMQGISERILEMGKPVGEIPSPKNNK